MFCGKLRAVMDIFLCAPWIPVRPFVEEDTAYNDVVFNLETIKGFAKMY